MDALSLDRIHFAFTITYHYLFPQLTMGLALLIVVLKTMAIWKRDEKYGVAARFWARIFAVSFNSEQTGRNFPAVPGAS